MYEEFYGLRETPFSVQPDPRFAYPSAEHKIAVAKMRYAADGKRGLAVLTGRVGMGKCLGKGTPVLMSDGAVKAVEDVQVGDLLMGPDSRPRVVLSLACGRDKLYRIVPTKGESYVVNEPHILSLKLTGGENRVPGSVVNISVRDYLAKSEHFKRNVKGYRVGVEFDERPVALEPYFLGLWLGDGASDTPRIYTTDVPVVDYLEEFTERIGVTCRRVVIKGDKCPAYDLTTGRASRAELGFAIGRGRNPVRAALAKYNLFGNKHIPQAYKANSREARLELLAGFIDADGYLTSKTFDLTLKNERLADDIVFLARSLGFAAYKNACSKTCYNNGVIGVYYRVQISGHTDEIPVRIPRKKALPRRQAKNVLMTAIDVQEVGMGEYYGFEIDGDRLFLLGDFTVTHNTTISNRLQMTWDEDPTKTVAFLPGAVVRTPGQFLRLVLESFGITALRTEAQNRGVFERFLLDEFAAGRHPILLLDEGQNLASRVIDAISDLTNFQTASTKLITVVMLAQDNLPKKLERHDAFRSRIAVVGHLDPLTLDEMREMIAYRLQTAGGGPIETYFEDQALADSYAITKGVPRDICVLCDALFVNGYVRDQRIITPALVERTLSEMSREKKWPVQIKDNRK